MSGQSWEAAAHEWARHVRSGDDTSYAWNAQRFFEALPPPVRRAAGRIPAYLHVRAAKRPAGGGEPAGA